MTEALVQAGYIALDDAIDKLPNARRKTLRAVQTRAMAELATDLGEGTPEDVREAEIAEAGYKALVLALADHPSVDAYK